MIIIRNKENKRLIVNLLSGPIDILSKSTAEISDEDFKSSHLQNLIGSGKIILVSQVDRSKKKVTSKKGESPKKSVPEPEYIIEPEVSGTEEVPKPEVSEIETITDETKPEESLVSDPVDIEAEEIREKERKKSSYIKRKK